MNKEELKKRIEIEQAFVDGAEIEVYNENKSNWQKSDFPSFDWINFNYRITHIPKYVPFTFEDREIFRGKWITNEKEGEFLITYIGLEHVGTDSNGYTYQELFENWTFIDGTPCGKLQQNN